MRSVRTLVPATIAASALLLSACGATGSAAGTRPAASAHPAAVHHRAAPVASARQKASAIQHVTIVGNDRLRFVPSVVHVHVGKVRITLKDAGAYPHNLVIPALKVTSASVTGDPGSTKIQLTVRFPHKGRYPFHCQYHQSAGMVGTFVVS